MNNIVKQI